MKEFLKKAVELVVALGLVVLCVVLVSNRVFADDALRKQKSEVEEYYYADDYIGYMYPVLPETAEWPYGNHQEMVDIAQIPEAVYEVMSTEELLESVLDYPLIGDILAYDDFSVGYKVVKEHFGALKELSEREDNRVCLEELRQRFIDAELNKRNESEERNEYKDEKSLSLYEKKRSRTIIRNTVIEVLIRQDDYCGDKEDNIEETVLPVLNTKNCITKFFENGIRAVPVSFNSIYNMFSVSSSGIYTPRGGAMTGFVNAVSERWLFSDGTYQIITLNDLSTDAQAALNNNIYSTYGLTPESGYGPSVKYNCHSYAWYDRVNCNYWVNQFNASGYSQVSWQNSSVGDIAVYYNTYSGGMGPTSQYTHSAVVVTNTYGYLPQEWSLMRSKWGMNAVYLHGLANCPYYYIFQIPMNQPEPCDLEFYH